MFQRWCFALAFMLMALPCRAQLAIGDSVEVKGNGLISTGYAGGYSNLSGSSHSLSIGGTGDVSGFYYNPSFVSFSLLPYYNQSRDNSSSQAVSDSSGINTTANIIKDSHFPGSISYSKNYNSNGTFGLAGSQNFTTHGNSQGFGIAWSALLPGLPTLTASFATGGGNSTVYGTSSEATSHSRSFGLRSGYSLLGFQLNANYNHLVSQSMTPELFSTQQEVTSNSSTDVYGFALSHRLPLRGAFSANVSRSGFRSDYLDRGNTNTTDFQNANVVLRPSLKMSVTFSENYSDNLAGVINQSIVSAGGVPQSSLGSGTHYLNLSAGAGYSVLRDLAVSGLVTHVDQVYGGKSYQANYFSGTLNGGYGRKLFGLINWSVSVVDNATEIGNSSTGVLANIDISHKVKGWDLTGSFNYAQNIQTLLVLYTNSYYRYSGQVSRRLGQNMRWSGQYGLTHSILNGSGNAASNDQNMSSYFSIYWLGLAGNYSKMNGTSILTTNGLQSSPVPTPILSPDQQITYGGNSYGFTITATPVRKLTLATSYVKADNNTVQNVVSSSNQTEGINSSLQYRLRKLGLRAGYGRFVQGISATNRKPDHLTTFYFGVYRSFSLY